MARSTSTKTHLRVLVLLCAGLLQTASCFSSPDKIRLQLKWYHQFQFSGFYAAQSQGFYRDEGLDVELIEGTQDRAPDKMVLQGKAEFGVNDGGDLLFRRLQGDPLVALAVIFQHSPYVIVSRRTDGIRHPSDLIHRKLLIKQDQGSALFLAMFRREGIKVSSAYDTTPIHFLPHTWNFNDVVNGRADAMSAYITEVSHLSRLFGAELSVLNPLDYGIDFYGDTLFTRSSYLQENPNVVARFRRASLKGWQ